MITFTLTEEQEHYLTDLATIYQQSPHELLKDFFEQYLCDKAETITETLGSFSADLFTTLEFRPFLVNLLTRAPGSWHTLAAICADLPAFAERIERDAIPQDVAESLSVMWLPNTWEQSDLVQVLVFCNNPFWHSVALVNREYILESSSIDRTPL